MICSCVLRINNTVVVLTLQQEPDNHLKAKDLHVFLLTNAIVVLTLRLEPDNPLTANTGIWELLNIPTFSEPFVKSSPELSLGFTDSPACFLSLMFWEGKILL